MTIIPSVTGSVLKSDNFPTQDEEIGITCLRHDDQLITEHDRRDNENAKQIECFMEATEIVAKQGVVEKQEVWFVQRRRETRAQASARPCMCIKYEVQEGQRVQTHSKERRSGGHG